MVTAVCVDNGEPNLENCVKSLRNQTIKVNVVIAAGPGTNMKLAESIADVVIGPIDGIGKARLTAIKAIDDEYVLSCDSDSIYESHYAEVAVEDLRRFKAVKATSVYPINNNPLGLIESNLILLINYEYALAFRRSELLKVTSSMPFLIINHRRWDIGLLVGLLNPILEPRMIVWTRLPTKTMNITQLLNPM